MKTITKKTLSTVPTAASSSRITLQTIHILEFIHRFRHVTSTHLQHNLKHTHITTTNTLLRHLYAKGYIGRRYTKTDRVERRQASYFLTMEGLTLLHKKNPLGNYRGVRSIKADAIMGKDQRERYHTLADTYVHFKRHYDGHFKFFSAFDIAEIDFLPDEVPDGYVRTDLPDSPTKHYFLEIYGWQRSNQLQERRLQSYLHYSESETWQSMTDEPEPTIFIVAPDERARQRLKARLTISLEQSLITDLRVYTTIRAKLDSTETDIWQEVQYS